MDPELLLTACKKKIRKEWICSFSGAIFCGLLANLYKMLNWLPNWDALVFYHSVQDMTNLGRPFLGWIDSLTSYYELPFLNGLLCLMWVALSSVCVIEVLDIRRPLPACLSGALLATYPAVTSTMYYAYTADGYGLQMFLACLGVLLALRMKKGYLLNALITLVICGTYPAYLGVMAVLWLLWMIKTNVFDAFPVKDIVTASLRFAAGVVLGGGLFLAVLKMIILLKEVTVSDYQSIDSALQTSGFSPLRSMVKCYRTFIRVMFCDLQVSFSLLLNILLLVFLVLLGIRTLNSIRKEENSALRIAFAGITALLLPMGCCVIYFISTDIRYHSLMQMGFSLLFVFILIFYDKDQAGFGSKRKWALLLVTSVIICNHIVIANASASIMVTAYERSYSYALRLADRIDQTPGATEADQIAIIGLFPDSQYRELDEYPMITGVTDGTILIATDANIDQDEVLLYMLRDYTGAAYQDAGKEAVNNWKKDPVVLEMPCWPDSGCLQVIGDTLIVKLEDIE